MKAYELTEKEVDDIISTIVIAKSNLRKLLCNLTALQEFFLSVISPVEDDNGNDNDNG